MDKHDVFLNVRTAPERGSEGQKLLNELAQLVAKHMAERNSD